MEIKLGIREIKESDINAECPFMPEPDDFEMYSQAFIEDISNLESVINVARDVNVLNIQTAGDININELSELIEPLASSYFQKLRTTGFTDA